MKKRIQALKCAALLCIALLLTALIACSASSNGAYDYAMPAEEPAMAPQASMTSATVENESYILYDADAGETKSQSIAEAGGTIGSGEISVTSMTEKIIYNASSTIETMEFDKSIETIDELMNRFGAFIESSSVSGIDYNSKKYGGGGRSANYTIRVPIENYSGMTGALDSIGNVTYLSTYAENVTTQYYDSQSRLSAYRTQEERLLAMLAKVDTIEAMIAIESELSSVRYNIESLQTQLTNWDTRVRYSTVSIYLYEVAELTVETPVVRTYWQQVGDELGNTLTGVARFFKNLLKGIIAALPVILILAVIAVIVFLIVRRVLRRRKLKTHDDAENKE